MLTLALQTFAGTVVVGPSLRDLAKLVAGLAPLIGISAVLGVIIGIIFRRPAVWLYLASALAGLVVYHLPLWWHADPDLWSWRDPITAEIYQFAPAVFFCAAPAVFGTLVVHGVLSWRRTKRI